jgi:hypothetical protein
MGRRGGGEGAEVYTATPCSSRDPPRHEGDDTHEAGRFWYPFRHPEYTKPPLA